jgi:pimeloyl-ACP methyl ester carboxylesterase
MERLTVASKAGSFAGFGAGDPASKLVILAHGFPDHPYTFLPLAERLVAAGYRVFVPWLRGYAPSTSQGPFDPGTISRDLIALADALSPTEPVYLVGHDWGASAVYGAAALAPERVRAVVTMAVPHPFSFVRHLGKSRSQLKKSWYIALFQLPLVAERLLAHKNFALVDRLYRAWSPGFHPDAEYMQTLKQCLAESLPGPIEYYRAAFRVSARRAPRLKADASALARIRVPTLYLHGADDGCIEAEASHGQERFFSSGYLAFIIPGVGHFLHLEARAAVETHVIDWLKRHE